MHPIFDFSRGLICRKIRTACFPTPGTAPKTRTFVVIFLIEKPF